MLVSTCLKTQKEKKNRKKKKRNRKCYYEVFKSKLASKHMLCLLLPLFFLSFFLLFSLFPLFFLSFLCFLCFGARIYSLTQWREILYIVDDVKGFHMKLDLKKIETGDNLEASLSVF